MTRDEMLRMWAEIQRLQDSKDPSDRGHALALIDNLADALGDKVLILDEHNCLYVFDDNVISTEIFKHEP